MIFTEEHFEEWFRIEPKLKIILENDPDHSDIKKKLTSIGGPAIFELIKDCFETITLKKEDVRSFYFLCLYEAMAIARKDFPYNKGQFYVYVHVRTDTREPFYIGKGKGNRAYNMEGRNSYHKNIQNKLAKNGHKVEVQVILSGMKESISFDIEKIAIRSMRLAGCKLANMTDGGEGSSGYKHTSETKALFKSLAESRMSSKKEIAYSMLDCDRDEFESVFMSLAKDQQDHIALCFKYTKDFKPFVIEPNAMLLTHKMRLTS